MIDIHDRDRKIIQWMKLGGLAHDLNHDEELWDIFQGPDDEPKIEVLAQYGLTLDDCNEFLSYLIAIKGFGWWFHVLKTRDLPANL